MDLLFLVKDIRERWDLKERFSLKATFLSNSPFSGGKRKAGSNPFSFYLLFKDDSFYRALLDTISTADARFHICYGADIVGEIQHFLLTNVNAEPTAGALIHVDLRPLVAWLSQGTPPNPLSNLENNLSGVRASQANQANAFFRPVFWE